MPPFVNDIMNFVNSPTFGTIQVVVLAYFGLLWLAIIIWVTRDSIHRSNSLLFQTFAILINILIPILGVLLYLIIRPGQTHLERYYEELERKVIAEEGEENVITCPNCMTLVDKDYKYCPNCSEKVKKACKKCKKNYPSMYDICPYCGKEDKETSKKSKKKRSTKKK